MAGKRSFLLASSSGGDGWHKVNWTARSLIAAGGVSVCLLMSALSATASIDRAAERNAEAAALAEEAALVAGLADYLAAETANARAAFGAPKLKDARSTVEIVTREGAIADFVDFDFTQLVEARADAEERKCLAQAIYFEAGTESRIGQMAVADVVLNRVKHPAYPDSICGVVYEGSHKKTGCQFTFTCDGSKAHRPRGRAWAQAQRVATAVMLGYNRPVTQGATHYHTHAVNPVWNSGLVRTTSIGSHVFYRIPNRSERAYYQEALARRRGAMGARRSPVEELAPEATATDAVIEETVTAPAPELETPAAPEGAAVEPPVAEGEVAT